ncbi:unnamed protein product [Vitrella brassicaformis CCMP3155]|uniref:Uncharacterized protein n=1 Tax=Vitrella brassicaformis (strain CCMP3155) TaxID=1169540 RepID=A0A0G4GM79_VITBC|nr:unnamed protein product [Vitrella brassicaformis CCMP3155]|eukprot:CEM31170.1 unnamed protein product [Vitrella brassicaformis CCMP3155]
MSGVEVEDSPERLQESERFGSSYIKVEVGSTATATTAFRLQVPPEDIPAFVDCLKHFVRGSLRGLAHPLDRNQVRQSDQEHVGHSDPSDGRSPGSERTASTTATTSTTAAAAAASTTTGPPRVGCKSRLMRAVVMDLAAVTIQRCARGWFSRRIKRFHKAYLTYQAAVTPKALKIQSFYRGCKGRQAAKSERETKNIQKRRNDKAAFIQSCRRRVLAVRWRQKEIEIKGIMIFRDIGATDIQRLWRGHIARQLKKKEEGEVVFVWDQEGETVDISVRTVDLHLGKDTPPEEVDAARSATPWQDPVRMKWCRIRKYFVHAVPRRIAEYSFKFFVDGGDKPLLHGKYLIAWDPDHPTDMRRRFNAIQINTIRPRFVIWPQQDANVAAPAPAPAGGNGADDQGQGQGGPSASSASEAAGSVDAPTEEQPESEGPQPQAATATGQLESPTPQGPPTTLPATSSAASIQESVAPSTTAGEG